MLKTTSLALFAGAARITAGTDQAAAIDAANLGEPSVIYASPPQQIAPVRTAYAERSNMGGGFIEFLFGDRDYATVLAHPQQIEAFRCGSEHPVLVLKLCRDALDRAAHPERLAAANAGERRLLFEDAGGSRGGAEVELRLKRNDFLGTGRLAQAALHAGIFRKPQHRPVRIVAERAGRTG